MLDLPADRHSLIIDVSLGHTESSNESIAGSLAKEGEFPLAKDMAIVANNRRTLQAKFVVSQ